MAFLGATYHQAFLPTFAQTDDEKVLRLKLLVNNKCQEKGNHAVKKIGG